MWAIPTSKSLFLTVLKWCITGGFPPPGNTPATKWVSWIRQFLSGILPKDAVKHIYIPKIEGKERRKTKASRAGLLGVEGMRPEVLTEILAPFTDGAVAETEKVLITKLDFYNDGLSGTENSSDRRAALARSYGLPDDISASALLEALNLISDRNEYKERLSELYSQIAY